jgi:hypothetical protein
MMTMNDSDGNATARLEPVVVSRAALEKLLHHAAFAAHLVGHLDDDHCELIGQIGDRVDTVVHGLTELLGDPGALAAQKSAAPDDRATHDAAPMLTSITGELP